MCGVHGSVITKVEIDLSPFKCKLLNYIFLLLIWFHPCTFPALCIQLLQTFGFMCNVFSLYIHLQKPVNSTNAHTYILQFSCTIFGKLDCLRLHS